MSTTLMFQHLKTTPMLLLVQETRFIIITCYMLKVLEKIGNQRPIHIITRSPNQYPNYETSNEIKPIIKNKGSVFFR